MMQLNKFADALGKHYTVVNTWFKDLETHRVHYVARLDNGEKIYDELDLEIGRYIIAKRTGETKWNFSAIYDALRADFEGRLRPFPPEYNEENLPAGDRGQMIAILHSMIVEEMNGLSEVLLQKLMPPPPKDPVQERMERMDAMNLDRRIRNTLRKEAILQWNAKPASERMIKAGLFTKVENQSARNDFIENYINDHYEEHLKRELE